MRTNSDANNNSIKLIEEIIQYLTKLIHYAPAESIACLRQMLKFLFGRNYGNRYQEYYELFIFPYFNARARLPFASNSVDEGEKQREGRTEAYSHKAEQTKVGEVFGKLFINGMRVSQGKTNKDNTGARHIKLFEPLVIYSLTVSENLLKS